MVDVLLELPGPEPRTVKLSSPDKVLWPDAPGGAVTKRGLADYLIAVSEPFLRLNGDRPMTLQRFPEGIEGEEFYQKNPPKGMPEWVRTWRPTMTFSSAVISGKSRMFWKVRAMPARATWCTACGV